MTQAEDAARAWLMEWFGAAHPFPNINSALVALLNKTAQAARMEEREACAHLVEEESPILSPTGHYVYIGVIAQKIRSRKDLP